MGLDGTLYDQVLDTIFYLGLAPARFSVSPFPCSHLNPPQSHLVARSYHLGGAAAAIATPQVRLCMSWLVCYQSSAAEVLVPPAVPVEIMKDA